MRLLVTGKTGQVGWELQRSMQCLGEVLPFDRSDLDLSRPTELGSKLDAFRPDVIINAAAYTAVDLAESDETTATRVNGDAPRAMAEWCAAHGALFLHYSTDYVFDGTKSEPWIESDPVAPVSAYGRSKLAGEQGVLASGADYFVLRTSWVFASRGQNFLLTMRRLLGEREELRIVDDQWGAPTSARLIADVSARVILRALEERRTGRFHSAVLHLTASGGTTWHGFASSIAAAMRASGEEVRTRSLVPITSAGYPSAARRPLNSRLDCTALERRFAVHLPHWSEGLLLCMEELH